MSSQISALGTIITDSIKSETKAKLTANEVEINNLIKQDKVTLGLAGKFDEDCSGEPANQTIANDILNDILETAMDIADSALIINPKRHEDTSELKEIVELGGTPPKNLGIGDSPPLSSFERQRVVFKQSKPVEKKSRITDFMNSKRALDNLLSEEQRRKQDEWEEKNEHVIQVIELQQTTPNIVADTPPPESFPSSSPDEEGEIMKPNLNDSNLEAIDLGSSAEALNESLKAKAGEGDERNSLKSNAESCELGAEGDEHKRSGDVSKRKKWGFPFKFSWFRKGSKSAKKNQDLALEK